MHPENSFVTLTYDDQHLGDNKLNYEDFQLFMKRLRKTQNQPIGFFCTGEYGDKSKRMHWHAILFNYRPKDAKKRGTTDLGHEVFTSETLDSLWGKGRTEIGSVTFESAGYCARYSAKKLGHGKDSEHEFQPISKKSNKNAIGKKWIEQYFNDVFNIGSVVLRDGTTSSIPRYYEKWLKEHQPDVWHRYISNLKQQKISAAQTRAEAEAHDHQQMLDKMGLDAGGAQTRNEVKHEISKLQLEQLRKNLKI